jgi:hypothetical protein
MHDIPQTEAFHTDAHTHTHTHTHASSKPLLVSGSWKNVHNLSLNSKLQYFSDCCKLRYTKRYL